jgi:membrane associated rhomboid family serine protease
MIPLSDGVPVQRFPWVNATLIAANFAVFLFYELPDQNAAISHASFYPCSLEHAGWGHILGNMWFLAVFGKNVEDAFGRLGYLIFYFAAGFVATMVQTGMTLISTASHTGPTLGASGALAAVMGAYLVLYPNSRVFLLVRWFPIRIHAWFYLGGWFLYQFIVGNYGLIHSKSGGSGIAFFAHIGGFIFGVLVALALIRAGRFRIPEAGWHGRWTHRS